MDFNDVKQFNIAVIGLGYVGLPLAVEFAKKYNVLGFDINKERVHELSGGTDRTMEADLEDLESVIRLKKEKKTLVWILPLIKRLCVIIIPLS